MDTSLYYDHGKFHLVLHVCTHGVLIHLSTEGGDKGARDLRDIRQEGSIRDGAHQASVFAGFEKYTKVSKKSKEMPALAQLLLCPLPRELGVRC